MHTWGHQWISACVAVSKLVIVPPRSLAKKKKRMWGSFTLKSYLIYKSISKAKKHPVYTIINNFTVYVVITYLSNYRRFMSNIFSQESLSLCLIHLQFDPKRLDFFSQVCCLRDISFLLTLQLPRKNTFNYYINNKLLLKSKLH